jgi:hypothetical protein
MAMEGKSARDSAERARMAETQRCLLFNDRARAVGQSLVD